MKKLTILLIAALVPMMAFAQAKRKPAAGKPATAAKAANNKFAIVLFDEWIQNVYEDAGNIYFQGTQYGDLNTLRAADKQTGAFRFVVPKKKSDRSKIICSGCDGTNIYMQLEEKGIVLFNGTDVNTSDVLVPEGPNGIETYYIWPANRGEAMSFSPNGRFLAMKADPCIVLDTQTKKVVRMVRRTEEGFLVTDNGDFYAIRENGLWKYPNNGGVHPSEFNKLNEKGIETFSFQKLTGSYYGEYHGMYSDAVQQAVYLPVKNKLLKFTFGTQQWSEAYAFDDEGKEFGGMIGCMIGVTDMDKARTVYSDILGYDQVVFDETGTFDDLKPLEGGNGKFRRVLLKWSKPNKGAFAPVFPTGYIELVQSLDREPRKIFEGRYWGDPGFIQICFDVVNMRALGEHCAAHGHPFTVDSCPGGEDFDMGLASGHFTYIEDPDGTLIEFVEVHRIPISNRFNIGINLMKRDRSKPLPTFLFRLMKLNRVKFD